MVTRNRVLAVVAAVAIIWTVWYLFPTKTRQIKRRFKAVASWVSKDGPEGNLAMIRQAAAAAKFFVDPCEFHSATYHLTGSLSVREISGYYFEGRSRCARLSLKFYDLHVTFPEKRTASVKATARLTGRTTDGDNIAETHEVSCTLEKGDNGWLFKKVTLVQVLKK